MAERICSRAMASKNVMRDWKVRLGSLVVMGCLECDAALIFVCLLCASTSRSVSIGFSAGVFDTSCGMTSAGSLGGAPWISMDMSLSTQNRAMTSVCSIWLLGNTFTSTTCSMDIRIALKLLHWCY